MLYNKLEYKSKPTFTKQVIRQPEEAGFAYFAVISGCFEKALFAFTRMRIAVAGF